MAVSIDKRHGLATGGYVYVKQTDKNGNWVDRGTIKDGSKVAGQRDNDPKPASVTYNGAKNLTTYVQVDNDGKAGDTDAFWRIVQDAKGNAKPATKVSPLTVTAAQGMKPGARIDIYNAKLQLVNRSTDNSGKDLDRTGNVKFSTLGTKGQDYRVNVVNKGTTSAIQLRYENLGMPGGKKYVLPSSGFINEVRQQGDRIKRFYDANGGNQAKMIEQIKKYGSTPGLTPYGAVEATKALVTARGKNVTLTDGKSVSWATAVTNAGTARTNWDKNTAAFGAVYQAWKSATAAPVVPEITKNAVLKAFSNFESVTASLGASQPVGLPENLGVEAVSQYNANAIAKAAIQANTVMEHYNDLMGQVTTFPGTPGQLAEAMGDANWADTVEKRMRAYQATTEKVVKDYADGIIKSVDVTRSKQAQERTYAILNLTASVLWFTGGALGGIAGFRSFASQGGNANNAIAGAGGLTAATGSGVTIGREAALRTKELGNEQELVVPTSFASPGVAAMSDTMKHVFWDIEAKLAQKVGDFQIDESVRSGGSGWTSSLFVQSSYRSGLPPRENGEPGWSNEYKMFLTPNDLGNVGYRETWSGSLVQPILVHSYKRWLLPK